MNKELMNELSDYDDASILLSNTNKLLSAVGITAKTILSIEELSRVASSMFVAVFESLFHLRIDEIIRNPVTKDHYEFNAQLVVDNLSDQIQMDLKHITGVSIVSGDIRSLSNLVHILVRIVSITSHDTLSSIDSSEISYERNATEIYEQRMNSEHFRKRDSSPTTISISTRDSMLPSELPPSRHSTSRLSKESPSAHFNFDPSLFYNEFLSSSLAKAEVLLKQEERIEGARQRRVKAQLTRESERRIANMRHAEKSQRALQNRWMDDVRRGDKSFEMRKSSQEHVMLRKIYQGLLLQAIEWKNDQESESKRRIQMIRDQTQFQAESMERLFNERVQMLATDEARATALSVKNENIRTRELLESIAARHRAYLTQRQVKREHAESKELLSRRESRENLASLMAVEEVFQRKHDSAKAMKKKQLSKIRSISDSR